MYLLWGTSESDQKVIKVAIRGISCIEIGHKSSSWKTIALATPLTSPTPRPGGGESSSEGQAAPAPLPPEWQCLTFVLKDISKGTMLLSTDNDVDAALWCVGLRMILEEQERLLVGEPPPAASVIAKEGSDGSVQTVQKPSVHPAATSSLFDLVR
jgi:hypothetical protein